MTWPGIRRTRPLRRQRTAWWTRLFWLADRRCAEDTHETVWKPFSDTALVGQCAKCRTVIGVVTRGPARPSWVAAIQPTSDRVSEDWGPGFLD